MSLPMTTGRTRTKHSTTARSKVTAGSNAARLFFSFQEAEDEAFRYIHLLEQRVPTVAFRDTRQTTIGFFQVSKCLTCPTASKLQSTVVIVYFH